MADFRIPRTGDRPLAFSGARLAESDGELSDGQHNNRYHTLSLYRSASGAAGGPRRLPHRMGRRTESSTVYVADTPRTCDP